MPLSGRLTPKQLCPSEPGAIRFLIGSLPARNSDRTKSLADLGATWASSVVRGTPLNGDVALKALEAGVDRLV